MYRVVNGYEIKIHIAKSLVGWSDLYYSCFKQNLEICSGCGGTLGISNFWGIYRYIKERIKEHESTVN